jgi:putative flavoprotein involved in K+ transport
VGIERFETVIVGGGQAGLAMGYHLARRGRPFVILEAGAQVGDSWRKRWDSLRLFTPARYDGLPGTPFPAPAWSFPTHEEFADYLRDYAARWELPVRTGVTVRRLSHDGERYVLDAGDWRYESDNVVVAAGYDRLAAIPPYAAELDPDVVQVTAVDYRNPGQLRDGDVLVVGAGNSGADIALELAATHRVLLSGRHPGQLPWHIDRRPARLVTPMVLFGFRHVLTVRTPMGRAMRRQALVHSGPLIRIKSADLAAAGIERVARTVGVADGLPVLADGRSVDVANVVWCTGFRPDAGWIDLPGVDAGGDPAQRRGVVEDRPGLYFLGRLFQYALASSMIQGVGRDADHIADHIATRSTRTTRRPARRGRRPLVATGP